MSDDDQKKDDKNFLVLLFMFLGAFIGFKLEIKDGFAAALWGAILLGLLGGLIAVWIDWIIPIIIIGILFIFFF